MVLRGPLRGRVGRRRTYFRNEGCSVRRTALVAFKTELHFLQGSGEATMPGTERGGNRGRPQRRDGQASGKPARSAGGQRRFGSDASRGGGSEAGRASGSPRIGHGDASRASGNPRAARGDAGRSTGGPRGARGEAGRATGGPRGARGEAGRASGNPRAARGDGGRAGAGPRTGDDSRQSGASGAGRRGAAPASGRGPGQPRGSGTGRFAGGNAAARPGAAGNPLFSRASGDREFSASRGARPERRPADGERRPRRSDSDASGLPPVPEDTDITLL